MQIAARGVSIPYELSLFMRQWKSIGDKREDTDIENIPPWIKMNKLNSIPVQK